MWDSNVHDKLFLWCRYHMFNPAHLHQRAAYELFFRGLWKVVQPFRALHDAIFCESSSCALQRLKNLNKTNRVELKSLYVYRLAFRCFRCATVVNKTIFASVLSHVFDRRFPEKRPSDDAPALRSRPKNTCDCEILRESVAASMPWTLVVGRCHAWISNTGEREKLRNSM